MLIGGHPGRPVAPHCPAAPVSWMSCKVAPAPLQLAAATPPHAASLPLPCRSLEANFNLEHGLERLAPLTGLDFLDLSFQIPLDRLPAVLPNLTGLRRLALNGCHRLTASDEAWRPLEGHTALQVLEAILCTGLTAVPSAISTMHGLQEVHFGMCHRLSKGGSWYHLAGLPSLTHLDLTGCGLRAAPLQLGRFAVAGIVRM